MVSRDPGLERRNQALLAERLHWPDGALKHCYELQDRFPGWHVSWLDENKAPGFERPAGYWATNRPNSHEVEILRADPDEVAQLIAEVPEHDYTVGGCAWCVVHVWERPVRL